VRFEPPLDRARLAEAVRAAYGLDVRDVTFVPLGLGSACYLVDGPHERRFLKVWPHLRSGGVAERQHRTLRLTQALHARVAGLCVPFPLPTLAADPWAAVDGVPFALFPLLPGQPPDAAHPIPYASLGRALAALHGATPALADVLPPSDPLDVPFEAGLLADLGALTQVEPGARPGLLAARAWVERCGGEVLDWLARLRGLRATVRALGGPAVLCHTDLHGGNLLVDGETVCLVDWDDARVAPPEHDLWVGLAEDSGSGLRTLVEAYRAAGALAPLRVERFAFYLLRRHLEDIAVDFRDLLAPDADPREDDGRLGAIEAAAAQARRLDATLQVVARALDEAR
jgi:spectinomycin phosphotransferase